MVDTGYFYFYMMNWLWEEYPNIRVVVFDEVNLPDVNWKFISEKTMDQNFYGDCHNERVKKQPVFVNEPQTHTEHLHSGFYHSNRHFSLLWTSMAVIASKCEFYVGTLSGPMDTAYLFNKPMLLTNMYDLFPSFPRKKNDRGIFKKIIDKKTGETINIKDFAKFNINYHHPSIDINDIMFEENSEEELYNAMKEYLDFINKKNHLDNIQIKFNEFLHKRLEEIYNEDFVKNNFFKEKGDKFKRNDFIKIIKYFKSCEGTYNSSYLQKNFYI